MRDGRASAPAPPRPRTCGGICIRVAATIAVAVVLIVLGYGFTAHLPRFAVGDAALTRFVLSTSAGGPTNISYNLTLTVTVRNSNWAMPDAFRSLEAHYLFDGQRFGGAQVVQVQAPADDVVVSPKHAAVFVVSAGAAGDQVVNLVNGDASVEAAYRNQSQAGVFDVLVGFCGQVMYNPHAGFCRLEVSCGPLRLKLRPHAAGASAADDDRNSTACKVLSPQDGC